MDTLQTEDCSDGTPKGFNETHAPSAAAARSTAPRLLRASEVDRDLAATAPLSRVLAWVRAFLTAPHPELGRKGPVCPFVPVSLKLDTIWMAQIIQDNLSVASISAIIVDFRDVFLASEPTSGPDAIYKALLVVFPSLGEKNAQGAVLVDEVQQSLKKHFVDRGLMLGEFHAANDSPGLRNPDFRPLRSPIPMLAIRCMVESDLPFLTRESYLATQRASFLRSYLVHLNGALSPAKFEQVLDLLVSVEVEICIARAKAGEVSVSSAALPAKHDTAEQSVGIEL